MSKVPEQLRSADKGSRIWFDKPVRYWYGWATLIPFFYGHDEYARRTAAIGWTITGRIIIALWYCGDIDCYSDAVSELNQQDNA